MGNLVRVRVVMFAALPSVALLDWEEKSMKRSLRTWSLGPDSSRPRSWFLHSRTNRVVKVACQRSLAVVAALNSMGPLWSRCSPTLSCDGRAGAGSVL